MENETNIPLQSAGTKLVIAYRVKHKLGRYSQVAGSYAEQLAQAIGLELK